MDIQRKPFRRMTVNRVEMVFSRGDFGVQKVGGAGENRTHDRGFADLGLTTWLPRHHRCPVSVPSQGSGFRQRAPASLTSAKRLNLATAPGRHAETKSPRWGRGSKSGAGD